MPELTKDQLKILLKEIKKSTLNISKQTDEKAIIECDEYIKTGKKNINDMNPLSVYYIISKLPSDKQISFIKENIKYIKEHDNDVFLYTMNYPKSLSYFLSYEVLKELKNIDIEIFKKVISQNHENLFHGFAHEEYCTLYSEFYNELIEVENVEFINTLYLHNRCCYENYNKYDLNNIGEIQKEYNKEFINLILKKYEDKISKFNSKELLTFIQYIEDIDIYREIIVKNYDKLNTAFSNIKEYRLKEYLGEANSLKQKILISNFFENIIIKQDIKQIIYILEPCVIIDLYNKNKEVFKILSLNDWIKVCSKLKVFNDDFKSILDTFEINNIEEFFDTKFYVNTLNKKSISALRYIEIKYRSNINIKGVLEKIDITTSIFSEKYIRNLSELKEMLKNKTISKSDERYKQHLANFILFLKKQSIINNIEYNNFKEVEKLFYRIVMGKSITILYELSNIEEITIFNRLGQIDFQVGDFTVEQLENYNVKHHKQLYKMFENSGFLSIYKPLIFKLMLMVGFNNAKILLEIAYELPVLEHLVGNVDVKNIELDNNGNPVLNSKLINLLFSDKNYYKIKEMLSNKDNDLYKYFPRLFNEWQMIVMNNKDKSLKIILDFLKSDEILVPPKYYRLEGLFKYIGCSNKIVNETLSIHDQILTRINSTIPRIKGKKDDYSYEILRLDDMEALCIGNKTDCCFTVLGNGYSCLKHALTSSNGRILVIKKDNELLAHSWMWRNGDLICLDNIEISKKINSVDFFDVYLQVFDELIQTSYQAEGIESCIKNITIGFTNFDKQVKGIDEYPCLISKTCDLECGEFGSRLGKNKIFVDELPKPIEEIKYLDSKNVQYLIKGNGIFNLGQSQFFYQDDRKDIMYYLDDNFYEENYIKTMNNKINALRYVKAEKENTLSLYKMIDIENLKEAYCNDDWYIICYKNGEIEKFCNSLNKNANVEINSITLKSEKVFKKCLII